MAGTSAMDVHAHGMVATLAMKYTVGRPTYSTYGYQLWK